MQKLFIFLLFTTFTSCAQNTEKKKRDPRVTELTKSIIPLVYHLENPDSCLKALSYLDSATALDSNCFLCYQNKIMFLNNLKQYDKIIIANNNLIRIAPNAHDLYMTGGIYYEKVGDAENSKKYFKKSLSICNIVLDTMNRKHRDYVMFTINKATDLIMLEDQKQAKEILKDLYDSEPDDPEWDNIVKKEILSLMDKNKSQIMEHYFTHK